MNEILAGMHGHQVFHQMRRDGWCIPVVSEQQYMSEEQIRPLYGNGHVAHITNGILDLTEKQDAMRKALRAAGYCLPPVEFQLLPPDLFTWNNGAIPMLARAILEEEAYHHLPILGDALEDGGCVDVEILTHCRNPGKHQRGCFDLDRILAIQPAVPVCHRCNQALEVRRSLLVQEMDCHNCKCSYAWGSLFFIGQVRYPRHES